MLHFFSVDCIIKKGIFCIRIFFSNLPLFTSIQSIRIKVSCRKKIYIFLKIKAFFRFFLHFSINLVISCRIACYLIVLYFCRELRSQKKLSQSQKLKMAIASECKKLKFRYFTFSHRFFYKLPMSLMFDCTVVDN